MFNHSIYFPRHILGSIVPVELISFFANIVTILGIVGLWIVYIDYKNRKREEKRERLNETLRAIRSVKYQLSVIGRWTNFENGGYSVKDQTEWVKKEIKIRGNPFHAIFKIEYSSLKDLNALPAIAYFTDDINEAIAWVKQWVASFNCFLQDIKDFSYSRNADKNIILHLKLNNAVKVKTDTEEERFMAKLLEMYAILHFEIIGDEKNKKLHYWHKRLRDLLDKLEKSTEQKIKEL
jgi:hypothetical protein